jgi:hypothetical protein
MEALKLQRLRDSRMVLAKNHPPITDSLRPHLEALDQHGKRQLGRGRNTCHKTRYEL